jgi:hypothetical protein
MVNQGKAENITIRCTADLKERIEKLKTQDRMCANLPLNYYLEMLVEEGIRLRTEELKITANAPEALASGL